MTPDARRAKELFLEAADLAGAERAAYLDRACGDDGALRAEVEALLAHDAGPASRAERGADAPSEARRLEGPGSRVGPYQLIEEIGEGGFGIVYLAEQLAPVRRRVALKILKAGMDTREIVTRFEAERQALALMEHPSIARVFDGGTTAGGRPYFVMELVHGVPLNEYSDNSRLGVLERLQLFVRVCTAVQHAHQKGVIHRDLKPSNILVCMQDGQAVPKVIDFGIAKAVGQRLTEQTFHTRFAQMIGTPQYMSPEQAEMSALGVDTRSDVYSLGVLLYELLTGTTPVTRERVSTATFDELRRMICEEDPPTPSRRLTSLNGSAAEVAARRRTEPRRLQRRVRGDLDWIAMRALEKDRARRYESAGALAADVERYLADEPVEAGPPSRLYRARKFARRHRTGVAAGLLALVALGWGAWTLQARGVRSARLEADLGTAAREVERQLQEAETLTDHPTLWREKLASARAGVEAAATLAANADVGVADDVRARLQALRASIERAETGRRIVASLERILIDRLNGFGDRAYLPHGLADYERAFAEVGLEAATSTIDDVVAVVRSHAPPVREWLVQGLDEWRWFATRIGGDGPAWLQDAAVRADDDPVRQHIRDARRAEDWRALEELAADPGTAQAPRTTLRLLERALMDHGAYELVVQMLSHAQMRRPGDLGINLSLAAIHAMQLERYEGALEFFRVAVSLRPRDGKTYVGLNYVLSRLGRHEEALAAIRRAIDLEPDLAAAYVNMGGTLELMGRKDEARAAYEQAIRMRADVPYAHRNLGILLTHAHEYDAAIETLDRAAELDPSLGVVWACLATSRLVRNRPGDAERGMREGLKAIELGYEDTELHTNLGAAYLNIGQPEKAVTHAKRAVAMDPDRVQASLNLGAALEQLGKHEQAVPVYEQALARNRDPRLLIGLANTLTTLRRPTEAIDYARQALALDDKNDVVYAALAAALHEGRHFPQAVTYIRKAADLAPDDPDHQYNLALMLVDAGDPQQAKPHYLKALRLKPRYTEAHVNLGRILYAEGQVRQAIDHLRSAVQIDARNPPAQANLGVMLLHQGEVEEAREHLECALEVLPDFPWAMGYLGIALMASGHPEEGRRRLDAVFGSQRLDAPTLNELAWRLATSPVPEQRDPERARRMAEMAAKALPQDPGILNTLGVAQYRAGHPQDAADTLRRALALQPAPTAFDLVFLAMAEWRLGHEDAGRELLSRAIAWTKAHAADDPELKRFLAEADALIRPAPPKGG